MKDKRSYPLRKVIERDIVMSGGDKNANGFITPKIFGNRLECGHIIRPAKDFYGEIFSEKQRCGECYKNLTA